MFWQGPGPTTDRNGLERIANVVTSLPYAFVGIHAMQKRRSALGKLWGASLVSVSAGAAAFHASSGPLRPICRKLDYWLIAASSTILARALFPEAPLSTTLLSLAVIPFQPFHVSSANVAALEVEFWRVRGKCPAMRRDQERHLTAAIVGAGCFFLEDAMPHVPLVHAGWHCLSAYATASCNTLLAAAEKDQKECV